MPFDPSIPDVDIKALSQRIGIIISMEALSRNCNPTCLLRILVFECLSTLTVKCRFIHDSFFEDWALCFTQSSSYLLDVKALSSTPSWVA